MRSRYLVGVFLISCTTLALEISLIRYFSISQSYHFAFLVVSITFLGYGAGGSILSVFASTVHGKESRIFPAACLGFSFTILLSFWLANRVPFDFHTLAWNTGHIWRTGLFYILFGFPFLSAGFMLALALSRWTDSVNRIYFADLMGAGSGTLLTLILFFKGDRSAVLILALLPVLAALCFLEKSSRIIRGLALCMLGALAFISIEAPGGLEFRISPFKALPSALRYPGATRLFTLWNAISRIDGIRSPAVRYAPGLSLSFDGPLPDQIGICTDGGELNALTGWTGPEDIRMEFLDHLPTRFPLFILKKPEVLILSPVGNLDILTSLRGGASHITVIEQNPLITRIDRKEAAELTGSLFSRADISLRVSHVRSAVDGHKPVSRYDLIFLPLKDVFGADSTGLYGLGENYLQTRNAYLSILACLRTGGMACQSFYLLPPPRRELRALATWIEALEESGLNPVDHIASLRSWGTIHIFIKKTPLSDIDIQILKDFAEENLFDLVHYPGMPREEANRFNQFREPIYYDLVKDLISPQSRERLYKDYLFRIRPVTDDRPFFDNVIKPSRLRDSFKSMGQKWFPFLQGELLVLLLFVQAFFAAFLFILFPMLVRRRKRPGAPRFQGFLYFSLIGAAFMLVEITLIQKFILFLGHPLYSTAVILFSLLFASGLGSLSSRKLPTDFLRRDLRKILAALAVLTGLYLILIPSLTGMLGSLSLGWKVLITPGLIFPLGFLMGIPFPSGIRILNMSGASIPWAWAVNSFSSVVSSVLALLLAFHLGYQGVLALAAGVYLLAFFLSLPCHRDKADA